MLAEQLELNYNSFVRPQVQKACLEDMPKAMDDRDEWRERERESGNSVQAVRHDDDDDD